MYLKYCKSKALFCCKVEIISSFLTMIFCLTTERPLVLISGVLYFLFSIFFYFWTKRNHKKMIKMYLPIAFVDLLLGLTTFYYWLGLLMIRIRFGVLMCNLFVLEALISSFLSCFFIGRIETVYHYIPVQYHERLSSVF
ncbi:uncharacterized protein [Blastocystis hominis]|uniref:Uncharacterized protein n=1 Tax=Blastocystis hominis TaxID=12968 RepID=D8LY80_BLAHO|nr:uncharacterized protein [Blastocystis hominis]CBK20535.2 unnamed protein product [Blastocystis hominis]|eukprot:XP_012894583.1 uncharacterized protein [Blastocystis hominis]